MNWLNACTSLSVVSSVLMCFSFSLDLLSDEPLLLFELSGSLLPQAGNLGEGAHKMQNVNEQVAKCYVTAHAKITAVGI